MTTASATDVKNHFGEYVEKAQLEPVMVQKSGRDAVVLISAREYELMQIAEDRYWGELATEVEKNAHYLSAEETMARLMALHESKSE
ncbi:MAG: type II toxin-antitoxin system prevent-host-death family antitoxin [Chthonomonadales bacterium]